MRPVDLAAAAVLGMAAVLLISDTGLIYQGGIETLGEVFQHHFHQYNI